MCLQLYSSHLNGKEDDMDNQNAYFNKYKEKLYQLLIHCKTDVAYYRENYHFEIPDYDDFTLNFFQNKVPLLEKRIVREDSKCFIIDGMDEKRLSIDSTSGTEGKPIICYRSIKERIYCSKSLWSMRRRFVKDLRPSDKFARFYAFRNRASEIIADQVLYKDNDILLPLFNLSDDKLKQYWKEIVAFQPRWLHGPSSTIYNLALVVKEYGLEPFRFEFIELSGEYVNEEHRKVIEEVFQCKTANQYGCREYWPMAYSNLDGDLEVIQDNIFIEQIYNEEHQKNEIVITLLKNNAWPLLRYRLEDLGEFEFKDSQVILHLERGRKADFFMFSNNRRFNAIIFSGLARSICEIYGKNVILQFQVMKPKEPQDKLVIRLHLNDCNQEEVMERYKNEVRKIVGDDIELEVECVDYIAPDQKTGKTKEFINLG